MGSPVAVLPTLQEETPLAPAQIMTSVIRVPQYFWQSALDTSGRTACCSLSGVVVAVGTQGARSGALSAPQGAAGPQTAVEQVAFPHAPLCPASASCFQPVGQPPFQARLPVEQGSHRGWGRGQFALPLDLILPHPVVTHCVPAGKSSVA